VPEPDRHAKAQSDKFRCMPSSAMASWVAISVGRFSSACRDSDAAVPYRGRRPAVNRRAGRPLNSALITVAVNPALSHPVRWLAADRKRFIRSGPVPCPFPPNTPNAWAEPGLSGLSVLAALARLRGFRADTPRKGSRRSSLRSSRFSPGIRTPHPVRKICEALGGIQRTARAGRVLALSSSNEYNPRWGGIVKRPAPKG